MDGLAARVLETWGPAGIIIVALALATITLWKRNSVIQDKRIDEANERSKQIGDLTREVSIALNSLTSAIASLRDMIIRLDK